MDTSATNLPAPTGAPDEKRFWRKLRRVVARVPFASDLLAIYYCALDPATPRHARGILFGAVAYFILPTDLIRISSRSWASPTMPP